jgi:hypothetical protein
LHRRRLARVELTGDAVLSDRKPARAGLERTQTSARVYGTAMRGFTQIASFVTFPRVHAIAGSTDTINAIKQGFKTKAAMSLQAARRH